MGQNIASPDEFIAAMRCVASSVSVVTTDGKAGRHGATVSAFCSVSADPPTTLVCLNMSSKIARLVRENGAFKLNVLPAGATDIADRFAGHHDAEITDRFEGITVSGRVPGLVGATTMCCTLTQAVEAGTHLVCIGEVKEIQLGANMPLTYLAGRYHPLSSEGAVI